jgi:hypothetical protein
VSRGLNVREVKTLIYNYFALEHLTIPLILDEAVNIDEKRLLEHELGKLFHQRRHQPSLRHGLSWSPKTGQVVKRESRP